MAIFHLSIKIISRSGGKSAVAASAYRAGEKLTETEAGYVHDYTRKEGVIHTEVFLPVNASPQFVNREILWNEVQKVEKQADAQMAREIEVALPIELSREEQVELIRRYVTENFTNEGMCADVAIHEKKVDGKNVLHQNPHAHILFTTRAFKEDGTWAPKEKKAYALDEKGERIPLLDSSIGLQKLGKRNEKLWKWVTVLANDWNDQSNAEKWRQSWADMCNSYLPSERWIDNRSFERQGLEQVPTIHEGYVARQMERKGDVSERMEINRVIRRLNQMLKNMKKAIGGIADRILKLKEELLKVRLTYEQDGGRDAASDIIRMARSAGADARANDTASRAIVDDSTAGRENRDIERKRQISERELKVKERKRGISR